MHPSHIVAKILFLSVYTLAPPPELVDMAKKVNALLNESQAYAEAKGYDYMHYGHKLEDPVTMLSDKMALKPWDVVIIGGGMKMLPEWNTPLEYTINYVKQRMPAWTHVIFVPQAEAILDTVIRAGHYADEHANNKGRCLE